MLKDRDAADPALTLQGYSRTLPRERRGGDERPDMLANGEHGVHSWINDDDSNFGKITDAHEKVYGEPVIEAPCSASSRKAYAQEWPH